MPTNLPPEYFAIDKRYRAAETNEERIALLEELISTIPKHKGTEKLRGDYKARLAKLRANAQAAKGKGRQASAFHVEREGAGQVVVIGCANTGKSTLVGALTNAEPVISDAPFTTWEPLPGMLRVGGVPVQLIDTPPLDAPFVEPELFQLIRRADLALLVVDLQADPFQQVEDVLASLAEHRIVPWTPDGVAGERQSLVPVLLLANKCDQARAERDCQVFAELLEIDLPVLPISATGKRNLDRLQDEIVARLNVIRVYAKPPGREPDLEAPFVIKAGSLLSDLGAMIHKDFLKIKFARVWGNTVHPGQMIGHDYVLQDGDIVELHV